jgi:hypothetical protein
MDPRLDRPLPNRRWIDYNSCFSAEFCVELGPWKSSRVEVRAGGASHRCILERFFSFEKD